MELIDREKLLRDLKTNAIYHANNTHEETLMYRDRNIVREQPTVEAIPIAEVKKFLEEGTKKVSNNVLAIIREDYIHKAEYESRLKADMVAMLEDLKKEMNPIKECEQQIYGEENWNFVRKCQEDVIQQKINALKSESEK